MSIDTQELDLKLEVKKQWFCDYCGEIIKSDEDGVLEWDSFILEEGRKFTAENFRIVHGEQIKECGPRFPDDNLSDRDLNRFTGPQGLSDLLSLQNTYRLDTVEFHKIIRRLHVDYYEEAIKYLPQALADEEYDIDSEGLGDISETNLIWLIKTYGK